MILRVDAGDALPVYEQIRSQIIRMAVSGTLEAGAKLPTIRQLAADLGLAKGTVAKAYELLESDKIVTTHGRHGTFVAEQETAPPAERRSDLDDAGEVFLMVAKQLGASKMEAIAAVERVWRDL